MTPRLLPSLLTLTACLVLASAASARSPLDGQLAVANDRLEPVTITVDGATLGVVAPLSKRVFKHVPNGVRFVALESPGAPTQSAEVAVAPRGRGDLRVAPLTGVAALANGAAIPLRLKLDGRPLGVLKPGARLETGRLSPGTYRLVARPAGAWGQSGPPMRLSVTIRAGERAQVKLGRYLGQIAVTNPFATRANVFIDGARIGKLTPGATLVLDKQLPGTHQVELRHQRHTLGAGTVTVALGGRADWQPALLRTGSLLIDNQGRRPITVFVDDREIGRIPGRSTHVATDLTPGWHQLTIRTRGGETMARKVHVSERVRATVAVGGERRGGGVQVTDGSGLAPRPVPASPRGW